MKKILLILLLCCSFMLLSSTYKSFENVNAVSEVEVPEKYYTTVNGYFYQVEYPLNVSPDSVEMWVKLPYGSTGGTLLACAHNVRTSWNVDIYGKFGFKWNNGVTYSFSDSSSLADGMWHHVALVRTDSKFTYYLDGEVEGIYEITSEAYVENIQLNVGVSKTNARSPLEGYVKQVTIYTGELSQEQILSDMQNTNINHSDNNCEDAVLVGNWNLGEFWTERSISNSVDGAPKADLHTYDKMFDVDYSFGEYDYAFAVFPDIQIMTNYREDKLIYQQQWLVDNAERLKVKFAFYVGDLSDFGQKEYLYERAAKAMSKLDNVIPYCFVPGNHDYDDNAKTRNQEYFNKHFPVSKHSQLPGFGGVYEEGCMSNSYYTINAGGVDYLIINLEYKPRLNVLRWANVIVEAHPKHRVIMNTHSYLSSTTLFSGGASVGKEGNGGQTIFDEFMVKQSNIFMGFGGHENNDEAYYRLDYGNNGNKIHSLLTDVQVSSYNGDNKLDVFLLVFVNETNKTMNMVYYSPEHDKAYNIQNQYQISFADPNNPAVGA